MCVSVSFTGEIYLEKKRVFKKEAQEDETKTKKMKRERREKERRAMLGTIESYQ